MSKRLKKKIYFSVILLLLAVIPILIMTPTAGSQAENFKIVEVKSGDSLWKIAKNNGPKNQDIRKTIYYIQKYNCLESSYIYEGQKLKVPIY